MWGVPPWLVDGSAAASAAPPPTCDVAVIGGGFTGLSAAYHLARRGVRVALLEATRLGDGASGRTGGLALEGTAHGPRAGVADCLDGLAQLTAEAGIDCALDLGGCWEVAHVDAQPRDGLQWRDGASWLRVAQSIPGGTLDPGRLVSGLARAAQAAGATLHCGARVQRLIVGTPHVLQLVHGAVRALRVVVALNGYTNELLALPQTLRAPLTLALCTAPLADTILDAIGLASRRPFYTVDLPYLWGRCLPDGRLLLGAGLLFADDELARHVDIRARESVALFARLEARTRALHPALAAVAITHRWGGPIAFRGSGEPLLGQWRDEAGILLAGAYAGHGVALSVRAGRLIADAIVDGCALPPWGAA